MTEELKQYYDKINSLWQSAKAGSEPAKIAIELAELVVKYYDTSDISDPTWLKFAGDMQQIGDRHTEKRSQMFLNEIAHSLMQMICKEARK